MGHALALAGRGLYTATPNPRVGCVIVRNGRIVGEGWHQRAGTPHAEAVALTMAGANARGATAYVTLEPCSHFGRTPPCADALIDAGLARVVAAMDDPNPVVSGRGMQRLRASGIATEVGLLDEYARELNVGFISRMTRGRPWVRVKTAATLDGKTALNNGVSQWITGPAARRDGHRWRARACAILTGIGTVRDDDPRLTVRDIPCERQPLRVLVDSRLEVSPAAAILRGGNCLIATASHDPLKAEVLTGLGAEIVTLSDSSGKVDLPALMQELGRRGVNEVHVEAGSRLNGSLLHEDCVDELLFYVAPMIVGDRARGVFELPELIGLDEARRIDIRDIRVLGPDVRILARLQQP